jgi:hypothetical protein
MTSAVHHEFLLVDDIIFGAEKSQMHGRFVGQPNPTRARYLSERGVRGGEQVSVGEMGRLLTVRLRARGELAVITFSTVFGWS